MATIILRTAVQPTIEAALELIRNPPHLPTPLPVNNAELLRVYDTYEQELNMHVKTLKLHLTSLEQSHTRWQETIQGLSAAKRPEEEVIYIAMVAEPGGLVQTINSIRKDIGKAEAQLEAVQRSATRIVGPIPSVTSATPAAVVAAPRTLPATAQIQLPKISLLEFSGDLIEWPSFWSAFERAVDQQPLDDADKLNYLLGLLKGKAKDLVKGFTVRAENYAAVLSILKEHFARDDILRFNLRRQLRDIPPVGRNKNLWGTVTNIERVLQQLEALGDDVNEAYIESFIEEKLPFWLADELYAQKAKDADWNVTRTRSFLRQTALRREMAAAVTTGQAHVNPQLPSHRDFGQGRSPDWGRPTRWQQSGDVKPPVSSALACAADYTHSQNHSRGSRGSPRQRNSENRGGRTVNNQNFNEARNSGGERRSQQGGPRPNAPMQTATGSERPQPKCGFCSGEHYSDQCESFSTLDSRLNRVRELKLCRRCLKSGHFERDCRTKLRPCFYCNELHQRALCATKAQHAAGFHSQNVATHFVANEQEERRSSETEPTVAFTAASVTATLVPRNEVLLMCKEVMVNNPEKPQLRECVVVFFDTGSHRSYIDEQLALKLELPVRSNLPLLIGTFAEQAPRKVNSNQVDAGIQLESGGTVTLSLNTMNYMTQQLQVASVLKNEVRDIEKRTLLQQESSWKQPQILIGMDYFSQFIRNSRTTKSGFSVFSTTVGPLLAGMGQMESSTVQNVVTAQYTVVDVNTFWDLEVLGIQNPYEANPYDAEAYEQFMASLRRNEDGRYLVKWPWKTDHPQLSANYGLCMGRLRSVLQRLQHHPRLLQQYDQVFKEQLELGIIERIPENSNSTLEHWLPHQPVLTPGKATTKLRVVFDASAKTKVGHSLNEELYRGPVILPELAGILLRFRTYKYVITADVEKAFLQVGLQKEDRDVTRFVWVHDTAKPPEGANIVHLRYCRVLFGVISSPFLLAAVIKHHLQKANSSLSRALLENLYVDNVLVGAETEKGADTVYTKAKSLFATAHMNLREFKCNETSVNERIPEADRNKETVISVLGLKWDVKPDIIVITFNDWESKNVTKRTVLSFIAAHFDPMGFIVPVLLPWKYFCQELWRRKYDWDEEVTGNERKAWQKLKDGWTPGTFTLPRLAFKQNEGLELHVFVDASAKAFATVIYARTKQEHGFQAVMVFAKSRIMPMERMTIPKAELSAATIGARALRYVREQLHCTDAPVFSWCDSKCAIAWLRTEKQESLTRYVRTRVQEIRKVGISYRYVPTEENPADLATRGVSPSLLANSEFWWHGPKWLTESEEHWPKDTPPGVSACSEEESEITAVAVNAKVDAEADKNLAGLIVVSRQEKWDTSANALKLALLFLKKCSKKPLASLREIATAKDRAGARKLAEKLIIRMVQLDITGDEVDKWNLRKNADGFWIVHGRIENVEFKERMPIYLPRSNKMTELMIMRVHEEQGHAGVAHTLTNLRNKFWVERGRQKVRSVLQQRCMTCRRWSAQQFRLPDMVALPVERVNRASPFKNTAIDYAGPMTVKGADGQPSKIWICLFTCLVTRAVHLECTTGLSTIEFMKAFKRFTARRGCPSLILSDNGTQFVAAAESIVAEWKFITSHAPWKGGVYERLVGLMKTTLRKAIGRKLLTVSELENLVIRTEAILNSRPITQVVDDSLTVLRPVDFLQPRIEWPQEENSGDTEQDEEYTPPGLNPTAKALQVYFKRTEACLERFWNLWQSEYLNFLLERTEKVHLQSRSTRRRTPRVGEVVLLYDENAPRGAWKLSRIVELPSGTGNVIRMAKIQVGKEKGKGPILQRPISHLYPLEITDEQESDEKDRDRNEGDRNLEKEADESVYACSASHAKGSQVATWPFFLLLLGILSPVTRAVQTNENRFHLCVPQDSGILVEIPQPDSCDISEMPTLHTRISLYTRKYRKTISFLCANITHTVCTKAFLRFSLVVEDGGKTVEPLSETDCRFLALSKRMGNTWLHQTAPAQWKSNEKTTYSFGWFGRRCKATSNFVLEKGVVATLDGTTPLTDLGSSGGCLVKAGSCISQRGIVIWEPKDLEHKCRYEKRGEFKAGIAQGRVFVDELQREFILTKEIPNADGCDMKNPFIMKGEEVVSFDDIPKGKPFAEWMKENPEAKTADEKYSRLPRDTRRDLEVIPFVDLNEVPEKQPVQEAVNEANLERGKGKFSPQLIEDRQSSLDAENSKLQYLYDTRKQEVNRKLKVAFSQRCEIHNTILMLIQLIAASEPTKAARLLVRKTDIVASSAGDALLISPCKEVIADEIYYDHKAAGICSKELPIRIGKQIFYVRPHSREIQKDFQKVNCRKTHPPAHWRNEEWRTAEGVVQVFRPHKHMEKPADDDHVKFLSGILPDAERERTELKIEMLASQLERQQVIYSLKAGEGSATQESEFDEIIAEFGHNLGEITNSIQTELDELSKPWKTGLWLIITIIMAVGMIIIICKCRKTSSKVSRYLCKNKRSEGKARYRKRKDESGEIETVVVETQQQAGEIGEITDEQRLKGVIPMPFPRRASPGTLIA